MAESKAKIKFEADTAQYNKAISRMQERMEKLKSAGARVFTAIGAAAAAVTAGAAFLIKKYREQEVAELKLAAALKTTNATRGVTLKQLKQIAGDFQLISLVGDEAGLEILQFGVRAGVAKENLAEFLATMADIAAATGKNAARVARAFQRGFGNATDAVAALNSVAVSLDDTQKAHLKTLFDNGRAVEAQAFILDRLREVYDGTAEALAEGAGRWEQFFGFIGDGAEILGGRIQRLLQPQLDKITRWIGNWVSELDNADKKLRELEKRGLDGNVEFNEVLQNQAAGRKRELSAELRGGRNWGVLGIGAESAADWEARKLRLENAISVEERLIKNYKEKAEEAKVAVAISNAYVDSIADESDDGDTGGNTNAGGAATGAAANRPPSAHERGGYDTLNRNIQTGNQSDDEAQAMAAKAAAEEAERARRVAEMEYQNETDRTALQMHLDGMNSEMIGFYERRRELEEAERLLLLEERTAENEAELEAVRIQKEALLAEEQAFRDANKKSALAHFGEMINISKAFGDKSSTLQKAQAIHNITTKIAELTAQTPAAAATAYQNTSEKFPFPIGPALGAVHAGLIVANAAAGISKAKGAISAQQGGIVPGAFTPRDSVPALLQPGEMIVPIGKPFQRVEADIEARGAAKARAENNRADMPPQEVVISFADDGGLSDFLRAEGVKNNRLFG